ncbi:DUF6457 domain-containing protein [Salana multivorans]
MTDQQRPAHHLPPSDLVPWSDAVAELYGLPERFTDEDLGHVLDVARDVSKGVARPAAPVTTFLLGVALGRATAGDDAAVGATDALTAVLARLAREVQDAALARPIPDEQGTGEPGAAEPRTGELAGQA